MSQEQIGELIPKLMHEIGAIGKDRKNAHQNYQFRGIDDVLNHVGPPAAKLGLRVETGLSEYQNERHEWEETYNGNAKQKFRVHVSLKLTLRFIAPDGSTHTCEAYGEGQDTSGDKATNKAMSAAFKYAVFMGLVIPVDGALDDSDNDAKQPDRPATAKSKPASKPAAPKQDPRVTVAKRIEADKDAAWFEVVPFEADGHPVKGLTLGDIVAGGPWTDQKGKTVTAKDLIKQVLDYIDPVALEHELAVKRLKDALAELENPPKGKTPAEPGKDDVPGF